MDLKKTIVVTGFGAFHKFNINISSESVRLLPSYIENDEYLSRNVDLKIFTDIPVSYKDVDEIVDDIWINIKPEFVIHVGLHSKSAVLCLEKCSYNGPYADVDVSSCYCEHVHQCCVENGEERIFSSFDMDKLKQHLDGYNIINVVSENPGLFLCGYIYYQSLHRNRNTIFLHVPENYEPSKMAEILKIIIEYLLKN